MKKALLTLAVLGLVAAMGPGQAKAASEEAEKAANKPSPNQAYLGLAVEAVPPALYNQLPGILPKGQGVLVAQVAKDSPAAKAGLKSEDILLTYADHKLNSPQQLVKLVRADKPGHEVALSYLRGGKSKTSKVTLGTLAERESPAMSESSRGVFRFLPDQRLRELFEEFESKNGDSAWESLDSLKLTRLDNHRWRAEVDFRNKENEKEHKIFEGTRQEIRKDIQAAKELPANERSHLLRALNLQESVFEFHFPPFNQMGPDLGNQP